MDAMLRAAGIYLFLLILFRIAGRRSLADMTAFDFVLLLIIGEATQQALLGDDFSITNALIVIATLIGLEMVFDALAIRSKLFDKLTSGVPMIIVENGKPLEQRMRKARITVEDVMQRARETRGIERLDQIKFAVLEASGGVSIIPMERREP